MSRKVIQQTESYCILGITRLNAMNWQVLNTSADQAAVAKAA